MLMCHVNKNQAGQRGWPNHPMAIEGESTTPSILFIYFYHFRVAEQPPSRAVFEPNRVECGTAGLDLNT
jgi:hypothetical protein